MKTDIKLCVTGGHLAPALAVIEEIRRIRPDWHCFFIGREHEFDRDTHISAGKRIISGMGIDFYPINTGRFTRSLNLSLVTSPFRLFNGIISSYLIIRKNRPDAILSFGGYLGFPPSLVGLVCSISVILHEQTEVIGLSNKILSGFADKVCLSFAPDNLSINSEKYVVTGLPLRNSVRNVPDKTSIKIPQDKPLLYIVGGTTGAMILNRSIYPVLSDLTGQYTVVHQTGWGWIDEANTIRDKLPSANKRYYYPFPYLEAPDHAWILSHAVIILSRAGANITSEIAYVRAVSTLVPLPISAGGEQQRNAERLRDIGSAVIVDQNQLSPGIILKAVRSVSQNYDKYKNSAQRSPTGFTADAAERIIRQIESVVSRRTAKTNEQKA